MGTEVLNDPFTFVLPGAFGDSLCESGLGSQCPQTCWMSAQDVEPGILKGFAMARRKLRYQLILFLQVYTGLCSRTCFEDAIPFEKRTNITIDGISIPLTTWQLSWDSSRLLSHIFEILAGEKLGFLTNSTVGPSSTDVLYMLGGCSKRKPDDVASDCVLPRRFHFCFESWQGYSSYVEPLLEELGSRAPVNLGSVGYPGTAGLFVQGAALDAGLQDSGLSLEFYSNYNANWFSPQKYTAKVSDVNMSRLQTCDETVNQFYSYVGEEYLNRTGDSGGVKVDSTGKILVKCWEEKWWLAPACRDNPDDCAPVITGSTGYGLWLMLQQAFWHNMPLAFATGQREPVDEYVVLGREIESLVYWWTPDARLTKDVCVCFFPALHGRLSIPAKNMATKTAFLQQKGNMS